jgi:hypothetical protein
MADSCASGALPIIINNLLLKFSISAFQEHGRTKRARLSTVDELQANTETHHSDERNLFQSITEESEMYTSQTVAQVSYLYRVAIVTFSASFTG